MRVAELFVKLGLDGAGDVSKGLGKISGSLKELFSMSIQTKLTLGGIAAGLTGAAFSAGKTGANLMAFKNAFGLSAQEMQKFSWATRQFGVNAEEAQGYIKGLQNAIEEARLGKGVAGTFGALKIDIKPTTTAFDVAKQLSERAKTANTGYYRLMGDLMSENMVAANKMMAKKGGLGVMMDKAPAWLIKSDRQLEQQRKISVAFENFGENLKTSMENFIADNGPLITKLIDRIEKLLKTMLDWISNVEKKSGFIADVAKGENLGVATAKAGVSVAAGIGSDMVEAAKEGAKAFWSMIKSNAQEAEAERMLKNAPLPKNKGRTPQSVSDSGEVNNFYINGIDVNEKIQDTTRRDLASAYRQLISGQR